MRSLIAILVLGAAAPAHAEVLGGRDEIIAAAKAGRSGAWLDDSDLKRCLEQAASIDNLGQQISALTHERDALRSEATVWQQSSDAAGHQAELFAKVAATQGAQIDELKTDLDAWYRNPLIMGAVGVLVGAAGAATAIAVLR